METTINNPAQFRIKERTKTKARFFEKLKEKYATYIQQQDQKRVYWYMKVVLIMTNAHMIISSFAMASLVDQFEYYIGFTVLVFFTNIIIHLMGVKSRVYVPVYYISLGIMYLIPAVTFLVTRLL